MWREVLLGGFWKKCFLIRDSPGKKCSPAPQSFVMAGCVSWKCLSLRTKPKSELKKGSGGRPANLTAYFHWHQRRVNKGQAVSCVMLLRWARLYTERKQSCAHLSKRLDVTINVGGFPKQVFLVFSGGTITLSSDKIFITAPFVRSSQAFLLILKGIPFQIILEL